MQHTGKHHNNKASGNPEPSASDGNQQQQQQAEPPTNRGRGGPPAPTIDRGKVQPKLAANGGADIKSKLQLQLQQDEGGGDGNTYRGHPIPSPNVASNSNIKQQNIKQQNINPPPPPPPPPTTADTPPTVHAPSGPARVCYRTAEGCGDWWGATTKVNTSAAISFSSHAFVPTPGWVAYARVAPRIVEDMEYNGLWQETVFDTVVASNGKASVLRRHTIPDTTTTPTTLRSHCVHLDTPHHTHTRINTHTHTHTPRAPRLPRVACQTHARTLSPLCMHIIMHTFYYLSPL